MVRRRDVWVLLVALLLVGCTRGEAASDPTEEPSPSESSEESEPEPSPSRSPRPSPSPTLEARYYQDSDGNAIPDYLEVELGYDPLVDDCALATDCPGVAELAGTPLTTEQNTMLLLDASGSMAGADPSGTVKIDAARAALERYVVGTPDSFNLGLTVFGHRGSNDPSGKAESCAGIDVFAPLGALDVASVNATLGQFQPTGYTPIAGALDRSAQEFAGLEGQANRIILVSDGIETCDADPVAAAQRLKQAGIAVTVDVVGFDVEGESDQAALRAIAEATGGTYTNAADAAQLDDYFNSLVQQRSDLLNAIICVYGSGLDSRVCVSDQQTAASVRLADEAIGEEGAREDALDELRDRIQAYRETRRREIDELTGPAIDRLRQELDEVRARYDERYSDDVAFTSDCPATQQEGPARLV